MFHGCLWHSFADDYRRVIFGSGMEDLNSWSFKKPACKVLVLVLEIEHKITLLTAQAGQEQWKPSFQTFCEFESLCFGRLEE